MALRSLNDIDLTAQALEAAIPIPQREKFEFLMYWGGFTGEYRYWDLVIKYDITRPIVLLPIVNRLKNGEFL